jgi:hypothetical protein
MTLTRIAMVFLALVLAPGIALANDADADAGQTLSIRTFQFKHKEADKAAAIIKPLMSADGSVSMQPGSNSLTVTDRPENLKAIAAALTKYDAPAQAFKLTVRLVSASRVDAASAPPIAESLKDVAAKLSMLRFNAFESQGDAEVVGHEGEPGIVDLGTGYRADFRFGEYDPTSDSVKVNDLRIARLEGPQKDQLNPLLKTSLNLKLGQTVILGASKAPSSQRALMIVVAAKR